MKIFDLHFAWVLHISGLTASNGCVAVRSLLDEIKFCRIAHMLQTLLQQQQHLHIRIGHVDPVAHRQACINSGSEWTLNDSTNKCCFDPHQTRTKPEQI